MFYEAIREELNYNRHERLTADILSENFFAMSSVMHADVRDVLAINYEALVMNETNQSFGILNESILTAVVSRLAKILQFAFDFIQKLSEKVKNVFRSRNERVAKFLADYESKVLDRSRQGKNFTYEGRPWNIGKLLNPEKHNVYSYIRMDYDAAMSMCRDYSTVAKGNVLTDSEMDRMEKLIEQTRSKIKGGESNSDIQDEIDERFGKEADRKMNELKSYTTSKNYEPTEISKFSAVSPDDMIKYLKAMPKIHEQVLTAFENDVKEVGRLREQAEKIEKNMPEVQVKQVEEKKSSTGDDKANDSPEESNQKRLERVSADVRDIMSTVIYKIHAYINVSNMYKHVSYQVNEDASNEFMKVLLKYIKSSEEGK